MIYTNENWKPPVTYCEPNKVEVQRMNKEEAIEKLKAFAPMVVDDTREAVDMAIEALSAEAKTKCIARIEVDTEEIVRRIKEEYDITDRWIPCSERLPEKDGSYLVCMSWGYYDMNVYMWADGWNCIRRINGEIDRQNEIDGADIIAWMPLPKPYREDGE